MSCIASRYPYPPTLMLFDVIQTFSPLLVSRFAFSGGAMSSVHFSFEEAHTDVQQVYLVVTHTRTSGR